MTLITLLLICFPSNPNSRQKLNRLSFFPRIFARLYLLPDLGELPVLPDIGGILHEHQLHGVLVGACAAHHRDHVVHTLRGHTQQHVPKQGARIKAAALKMP